MPSTLIDLKSALHSAIDCLESHEVGSPRMNAEMLLMHTLDCDRAYLFAHPERELSAKEIAVYTDLIQQRARGIPAQYLVGHQEFWGLDFLVSPAVLIPRPETEHLVESAIEIANVFERPVIVDVGTGSGCVALSLANDLPKAEVHSVDLSPEALEVARANSARLRL